MSERYGAPGEHADLLQGLEEWLNEETAEALNAVIKADQLYEVRHAAIRLMALGEVLDFIMVNPGG